MRRACWDTGYEKKPDSEEQNSGGNEISQLSRSHFRYLIRNIMSPSGWELFRPKKGPIFLTEDGKNKSCEMFPLILGGTFLLLFFQILCQIVSFDFSLVVRDPGHTPLANLYTFDRLAFPSELIETLKGFSSH